MKTIGLAGSICLYWLLVLCVAFLAAGAPCGLAPDASCELDGASALGALLGFLGPLGVVVCGALLHFLAWTVIRRLGAR